MHKTIRIQVATGIIISLAIIFGASFWMISKSVDSNPIFVGVSKKTPQKVCTQEAKMCPDGSYVGRSGPKCNFSGCPTAPEENCVAEGESIGAVRPGVIAKKCCAGMDPVIPKGIIGTQGICQFRND